MINIHTTTSSSNNGRYSVDPSVRQFGSDIQPFNRTESMDSARGQLFGEDGFSFSDILDIINPLQHIPLVNTLYRKITGDTIAPAMEVAGGALFGGPIGALASLVMTAIGNSELTEETTPPIEPTIENPHEAVAQLSRQKSGSDINLKIARGFHMLPQEVKATIPDKTVASQQSTQQNPYIETADKPLLIDIRIGT